MGLIGFVRGIDGRKFSTISFAVYGDGEFIDVANNKGMVGENDDCVANIEDIGTALGGGEGAAGVVAFVEHAGKHVIAVFGECEVGDNGAAVSEAGLDHDGRAGRPFVAFTGVQRAGVFI